VVQAFTDPQTGKVRSFLHHQYRWQTVLKGLKDDDPQKIRVERVLMVDLTDLPRKAEKYGVGVQHRSRPAPQMPKIATKPKNKLANSLNMLF